MPAPSRSVVGGGARIGGAHRSVLMDERLTFALVNTDRPRREVIRLSLRFQNKMASKANSFRGARGVVLVEIKSSLSSLIRAGL